MMMNQSQQQTQLMIGLMTAMMSNKPIPENMISQMDTLTSIINKINPPKAEKPLLEQVKEMQALGIIKPPGDDDAMKSLEKIKIVMGLVQEFTGAASGERPTIIEKLIDVLGPHIPGMVGNITKGASAIADMKKAQAVELAKTQALTGVSPQLDTINTIDEQENISDELSDNIPIPLAPVQKKENLQAMQIKNLSDKLYGAVISKDVTMFPIITQVLGQYFGGEQKVTDMIKDGQFSTDILISYVLMFDKRYTDKNVFLQLQDYIHKYIESFNPPKNIEYVLTCPLCKQEHVFASKQEYLDEKGENNNRVYCNINECLGELEEIK